MGDTVKVTLLKSGIGRNKNIRETLTGLGLTKLHKTVVLKNTPAIRGMIEKVSFMVKVRPKEEDKMRIHELSPAPGSTKSRKRVGRGRGSGHGRPPAGATKVKRPVQAETRVRDSREDRCPFKGVSRNAGSGTSSRSSMRWST